MKKVLIILFALFTFACGSEKGSKTDKKTHLPVARGSANVILAVMDTNQWNGKLGETLKDIFAASVPGLPQDEPYFKIRNINPLKMNTILKSGKNMLFVSTLDKRGAMSSAMRKYFTPASLEKIKKDTALYKLTQKDMFARGQEIVHLFGQTEEQLIHHLQVNKSLLRNYFLKIENDRLSKSLFKVREKQIERNLEDQRGFTFNIPYGYDLAKSEKNFVWLRQLDPEYEKDVFVYFKPFDSQEPFEDVMAYREEITSTYMSDIQKPEIYMTLQKENRSVSEVNFLGNYAKETRGLWKLTDISSGGPFVSYLFVSKEQKRIYYVEGYVYAPSKDKRVFMQEVEAIVNTFRIAKE